MSVMHRAKTTLLTTLVAVAMVGAGMLAVTVYTSTSTDSSSTLRFQVTWTATAPADVWYQLGGTNWVEVGEMTPVARHKGWQSPGFPYDPKVTYRLKVMQYDRADLTTLMILVDEHQRASRDNQHPSQTIPILELRGS